MSRLRTQPIGSQSAEKRDRENPQLVRRGILAEDYDGISDYVAVSLAGAGIGSVARARVTAGSFHPGQITPTGTPVLVVSNRGTTEIIGSVSRQAKQTQLLFGDSTGVVGAAIRYQSLSPNTLTIDDGENHVNPLVIILQGEQRIFRGAATNSAFMTSVDTDAAPYRFLIKADGKIEWGPSGTTRDITLARSAAGQLTAEALSGGATVAIEGGNAVGEGGRIRLNGGSTDDDWSIRAATTDSLYFRNETQADVPMYLNWATARGSNLNLDGFIDITRDTATQAIRTFVTGDTNPRVNITATSTGGKIDLGLGNGATDIHISRDATDRVGFDTDLGTGFLPMIIRKASDQIIATTTLTDVSSLSFPVRANIQYSAQWIVSFTVGATTDGIKFAVNGPVSCSIVYWVEIPTAIAAGTDIITDGQSSVLDTAIQTAAIDGTARHVARITAVIDNGANAGTVALRSASDTVTTGTVTIKGGSWAIIS